MQKRIRIIGITIIVIILIVIWGYYDLKKDPSRLYIPGRDTLLHWDNGKCEIIGSVNNNTLILNKENITSNDNYITAYKMVDDEIFFFARKGKIVVDLKAGAYVIYEDSETIDIKHMRVFADSNSFILLSEM